MIDKEQDGEMIKTVQVILEQMKIKQCLWCNTKDNIINAHSIQHSILKNIEDSQHNIVHIETLKFRNSELKLRLNTISSKSFSTFTGFCKIHDAKTFEPIEKLNLYTKTKEQHFIFAFRALSKELHAKKEASYALKQYKKLCLNKLKEDGIEDPKKIWNTHPAFHERRREKRFNRISIENLTKKFDQMKQNIVDKNFEDLYTITIELNQEYKIVANSIFFPYRSPSDGLPLFTDEERVSLNKGDINPRIFFNLFPQQGKTYVVFSCFSKYKPYLNTFIKNLDPLEIDFLQQITILLFMYTENIGFSSDIINALTSAQKQFLIDSFESNLLYPELFSYEEFKEKNFNLFELMK